MMGEMGAREMWASDVAYLAERMSEGDRGDVTVQAHTPETALWDAYAAVRCWTVTWGGVPIGVVGRGADSIFSLWTDLTRAQKKIIMQWTPRIVTDLVRDAGCPLSNFVREDNRLTITWLKASHCFDFIGAPVAWEGHRFLYFSTKPLGDLERV